VRRSSILIPVGVVLSLCFSTPALATFPGHDGLIAFSSSGPDSRIYTIKADGTDRRALTTAGEAIEPVWSLGGSEIAYLFYGHGGCRGCLYVMNADGSNKHLVLNPANTAFGGSVLSETWSPTGSEMAFCQWNGNLGTTRIGVTSSDGMDLHYIDGNVGDLCEPAWSPDGRLIAVDVGRNGLGGTTAIDVMRPDGTHRRAIVTKRGGGAIQPSWAPDSSSILYGVVDFRSGQSDLFSVQRDGTGVTRLTDTPRRWELAGAVYAPNGKRIVFSRARTTNCPCPNDLWKMHTDGSGPHPITRTKTIDESLPDWQAT
jgi:TolB protein